MSKITVGRALAARIARRTVRLLTVILAVVLIILVCLAAVLAYYLSPWWWLLLLPVAFIAIVFIILRLIVLLIVGKVHTDKLTKEQRDGIDNFIGKIQRLFESRATPPWVFALVTIKDVVIHRDITTIKAIISDSVTLRRDYQQLEKLFD